MMAELAAGIIGAAVLAGILGALWRLMLGGL